MSDRIKKIKVKKADGSMTDYIPIGVDAENVDFDNGYKLDNIVGSINPDESGSIAAQLSKSIKYYDCVADMKADTTLNGGGAARTLGYYEPGDGGDAIYNIVEDNTLVDDGGSVHDLDNGLKAKLIIDDTTNILHFGAKGDGISDNTNFINNFLATGITYLFIPKGNFKIENRITVPTTCNTIYGISNRVSQITGQNGIFDLTSTSRRLIIKNLYLNGVSKDNNNIGIDGKMFFSKFENLRFRYFNIAIQTLEGTYIDHFYNCDFDYCNYGIKHQGSNFNNMLFSMCTFQHITEYAMYSDHCEACKFVGCNFEGCGTCLYMKGTQVELSNCYCEGNDNVIWYTGAHYGATMDIHNCWLYGNYWLANVPARSNVDSYGAVLNIHDNTIATHNQNSKLITFYVPESDPNANKSYLAVNFYNNTYTNLPYKIHYIDLIDFTNCSSYSTIGNPLPTFSDLPYFSYDHCEWYKETKGNLRGAFDTQSKWRIVGYIEKQSTGASTITIDDIPKYVFTAKGEYICYAKYDDGTIEPSLLTFTNYSKYNFKVNSTKNLVKLILNCTIDY